MKNLTILGLMTLIGAQAYAVDCKQDYLPKGFVYLDQIDPTIDQKIGFATTDNILGIPADGYEVGRAVCTKEAATALTKVQKKLKKKGLCLQVMDAYRPDRAVRHIQRWAQDWKDQKTKARYYPTIDKKDIWGTYVAAKQSSHSRGSTVDVLIVDDKTKEPLDFGPDFFGEESWTHYSKATKEQRANRLMLRKIMMAHGFKPYDKEFWHFTLKDEPFPKHYFDFVLK
jgi:D-alanyl-D-alanine dipeptidase